MVTGLFDAYAAAKAAENTPGLARSDGAQTSREAADSIAHISGEKRVAVLRALRTVQRPAISEELEYATGFSGNTVRPRLCELADDRKGPALVRKTGERGTTKAGRPADLWEITGAGLAALRKIEEAE